MTISHRDARILLCEGYRKCFGHEPARAVAQLVQAVAILETNYGQGWGHGLSTAGSGSNNWGAITAGREWTGDTFEHKDSRPKDDGTNEWYVTKFRVYPTPADGAKDLIRIVFLAEPKGYRPRHATVLPAALGGDPHAFSAAMYDTGYYRGFGKTRDERIAGHHKAVTNAIARVCKSLGEEPPNKVDAALYNEATKLSEAEDLCWVQLRAQVLAATAALDVIGIVRADGMRDMREP